jgi:hypothetical protein
MRGMPRVEHTFLDVMNDSPIVVIATVVRSYHRNDKCTVVKRCTDSGLVIQVSEIIKGKVPKYVEAYKSVYSSCFSGDYHPTNIKRVDGVLENFSSYSNGTEYLFVLRESVDDYMVVAGNPLEHSLALLKQYGDKHTANKKINKD